MKILFLNAYFIPESIAFSHLENGLIEKLVESGHTINVICPTPTRGITDKVKKQYKKIKFESLYCGRLKVRRFWSPQEGKNPIIRAFRYIWCNIREYQIGKKYSDTDVIFAVSTPPTQGYLAGKLGKKLKCPFIYNLQDIFPDSLVNAGMTKEGSLIWKIGRKIEDRTYRYADSIVVISEDFKKNIMEKGVPEEKITIIRNWVDEQIVVNVKRENNSLFDTYGLDRDKFYICYSGNIGMSQNMDMLLDTAKELIEKTEIGFILVGDGAAKSHVEERIQNENISNITMIPFQPYEKISEVFSLGDCGLIISKAGIGNNSVPSKTWSIMSAERPVLASFDKGYELDRVITEAGCGVCVQADDKETLKIAILELYRKQNEFGQMGANGRRYIMNNLTREIGTGKWVDVVEKMGDMS